MSLTVLTNAVLIDCTGRDPVAGAALVVEDDRIKDVLPGGRVGALPGRSPRWTAGAPRYCRGSPTRTSTSAR